MSKPSFIPFGTLWIQRPGRKPLLRNRPIRQHKTLENNTRKCFRLQDEIDLPNKRVSCYCKKRGCTCS